MTTITPDSSPDTVREAVRSRYAAAALAVTAEAAGRGEAACCGADPCCDGNGRDGAPRDDAGQTFGASQYDEADRRGLPADAVRASLGCGNPLVVAELNAGERVLDLGSGGGIDVLLSARRVGPTGYAYGLDMTDEMLALARRNAADAGATNVEFLRGHIEQIPLPDGAVDVVISNCVVNLSADKPAVFAEVYRVLRAGGRIGISDIVAGDHLTQEQRAAAGDWEGCAAGALSRAEYVEQLRAAGFGGIEVRFTHTFDNGMHSAVVRAVKPAG